MKRSLTPSGSPVLSFVYRIVPLILIVLIGPRLERSSMLENMSILLPALVVAALVALWIIPDLPAAKQTISPSLLGFLAAILAPASTTREKFYEATAQIVPVLFVALAIETRAFQIGLTRSSSRVVAEIFLAVPRIGSCHSWLRVPSSHYRWRATG